MVFVFFAALEWSLNNIAAASEFTKEAAANVPQNVQTPCIPLALITATTSEPAAKTPYTQRMTTSSMSVL